MPVHIEELAVRNLGPITDFQLKLGTCNLIYGRNEHGKTYLVEFLLKSLFRTAAKWRLRSLSATGKVVVSGLGEDLVSFSPSSHCKLEDFLEEVKEGLPLNLARLLVVKGAELGMAEGKPGGIDRAIVKEYLSSEAVLDAVQSNISKTLQESSIEKGEVIGPNRGEIKARRRLAEQLATIDRLFTEMDQVYSAGPRASLNKRLEDANNSIEAMTRAKRHEAYLTDKELTALEHDRGSLPREELGSLRETYKDWKHVHSELQRKQSERDELKKATSHYDWLTNAIDIYEKRRADGDIRATSVYALIALLSLIAAVAFAFLEIPMAVLASVLVATVAGGLHFRGLRSLAETASDIDEMQRIAEEFELRFGRELSNLPAMLAVKGELEPGYYRGRSLDEETARLRGRLHDLEAETQEELRRLSGASHDKDYWGDAIGELEARLKNLEEQIRKKENRLNRLNLDPSDFVEEDPGVKYEKSLLSELELEAQRIKSELRDQFGRLDTLKQKTCLETADDISIEWEDLIQNLKSKREESAAEYRQITSEIVARILLNTELGQIKDREDQKIDNGLTSSTVTQPMLQVTRRYEKVRLEGDQLVVSDQYSDFYLSDLSTGAQEQVLLALRVGFASKIMGQESLFLILDDAFQHADWERRPWLLDKVVDLAKGGWQIIYLTMDDHIRDMFNNRGAEVFGDEFCFADLGTAVS